jgi:hypothetical protein
MQEARARARRGETARRSRRGSGSADAAAREQRGGGGMVGGGGCGDVAGRGGAKPVRCRVNAARDKGVETLQVQGVTISAVRDLRLRGAPCPRFGGIFEIRSAAACPVSIRYFTFSKSPGFDLRDQMKFECVYRYACRRHTKSLDHTHGTSWTCKGVGEHIFVGMRT